MYRRFLNNDDYLGIITPEALAQLTRGNDARFIQAEESAEMSIVEYLSENYEIEKELGIATCPVNWPIGSGKEFRGVYDREHREIELFSDTQKGTSIGEVKKIALDDPSVETMISEEQLAQLTDEVELLDGASAEFDMELVSKGELSPVFLDRLLQTLVWRHFFSIFFR